MNIDTKNKSRTSKRQSKHSGQTQNSDVQNWINKRLKLSTYESKSDLSCIALNQGEMDLVFEAIESAIRITEKMDGDIKDFALPMFRDLRQRFAKAP